MLRSADGRGRERRVTMLAYYRYQLHFRLQQYDLIFRGGRLFQQYVVGVFCAVEQNRLDFIRKKQNYIRAGKSTFFITFTCNVNSPEIKRFMAQYPELLLMERMSCSVLYTVEFQKRGFPHCHTLLWVDSKSKIKSAEDVDQYISAELLDPRIDPDGYNIVSEMMMHGPCGAANMKASCMKGDKCGKSFPKKFNSKTFFDDNGHVHY
ncbi:hypothetical protein Tco_1450262 [Tanacetum coccineum]